MADSALKDVKALLFDVFGTAVDWRSTVTNALYAEAQSALNQRSETIPQGSLDRLSMMDLAEWGKFAQEWRVSYYDFTSSYAQSVRDGNPMPYKTVDEHHLDSLEELLTKWNLQGIWSRDTIKEMSLIWHYLNPWEDTVDGIRQLNKRFATCTLSNGNFTLLKDMAVYAQLEWTNIFSAEMFKSFKPDPQVYLGAAERLGLKPEQCAMVAAHLGDLRAAKRNGLRVIYVARPQEEMTGSSTLDEVKNEGWVDMWIGETESGFLSVAEKLGVR